MYHREKIFFPLKKKQKQKQFLMVNLTQVFTHFLHRPTNKKIIRLMILRAPKRLPFIAKN